jgi:hypothetical protein
LFISSIFLFVLFITSSKSFKFKPLFSINSGIPFSTAAPSAAPSAAPAPPSAPSSVSSSSGSAIEALDVLT